MIHHSLHTPVVPPSYLRKNHGLDLGRGGGETDHVHVHHLLLQAEEELASRAGGLWCYARASEVALPDVQ